MSSDYNQSGWTGRLQHPKQQPFCFHLLTNCSSTTWSELTGIYPFISPFLYRPLRTPLFVSILSLKRLRRQKVLGN